MKHFERYNLRHYNGEVIERLVVDVEFQWLYFVNYLLGQSYDFMYIGTKKMRTIFKVIFYFLFFIIVSASGFAQAHKKSEINIFSSGELFRESCKEDLYRFHDYRTRGYGYKSEKDTSKYIVEPIFESVDFEENYIKLFFDLNKTFYSELGRKIKSKMPERTGLVQLLANKDGFIDFGFEHDIPTYYKSYCDLIPVKKNNLCGCINRKGELIIPYQYELLSFIDSNLIWVSSKNKCGLIDTVGKIITPMIYDMIDFPITKRNNIWGIMDRTGRLLLDNYDKTYELYDVSKKINFFCGIKKDKCDLFNDKGKYIISFENEKVLGVDDSIITLYKFDTLEKKSRYRYFNIKTKRFLGEGYDDSVSNFRDFKFGNAIVSKNYKCGVINAHGELILPCEYESVDIGKANIIAGKNRQSYLFDRHGNQIAEYPYYKLDFRKRVIREDELFIYKSTGMGLIDLKGNILIEPKYDTSFYFDGYHWFLFDLKEKITCIYNANTKKIIDKMKY